MNKQNILEAVKVAEVLRKEHSPLFAVMTAAAWEGDGRYKAVAKAFLNEHPELKMAFKPKRRNRRQLLFSGTGFHHD
ncbi:MAG: hypothetical protein AAB537_02730 [Patescibacteria group bacterium]